jgi:hypothetical protein
MGSMHRARSGSRSGSRAGSRAGSELTGGKTAPASSSAQPEFKKPARSRVEEIVEEAGHLLRFFIHCELGWIEVLLGRLQTLCPEAHSSRYSNPIILSSYN